MNNKKECATPLTPRGLRALKKNGRMLLKEAEALRRKHLAKLEDKDAVLLESALNRVRGMLEGKKLTPKDIPEFENAQNSLDGLVDEFFGFARKTAVREYIESILYAVVIALVIRTALVEPFKIPTGSMIPTLEINDHIFVSKFAYGVRIPFTGGIRLFELGDIERGDVIVFENPGEGEDQGKDFIKRVVGVAGDMVRMEGNGIVVNDVPIPTQYEGIGPCEDTSGRECAFQQESAGTLQYQTQHVIPAAYKTVSGETLGGIARKVGLQPTELLTLNGNRLDKELLASPDVLTRPLEDDMRIQIRSPRRWNFGNSPQWPLPRPACPLETQSMPCYGAEALDNPDYPNVKVPEGHVLTFGDNRDNSRDGRFWGFVPVTHVKGKAFIIWYAEDTERIFTQLQ